MKELKPACSVLPPAEPLARLATRGGLLRFRAMGCGARSPWEPHEFCARPAGITSVLVVECKVQGATL